MSEENSEVMNDDEELNAILASVDDDDFGADRDQEAPVQYDEEKEDNQPKKNHMFSNCKYSQLSESIFTLCGPTSDTLDPGVFQIHVKHGGGIIYTKIPVKIENLVHFPDSTSETIITEITKFWEREGMFKKFKLPYKRGILLWGPAGSGKSSTIQVIMKDVIDRDGVVFLFDHPSTFIAGYNAFRKIQPDTPVVVIMEDIDDIIRIFGEHEVLQILDGVHKVSKTIFLATTNYPEKLKARVVNRPSRFDKRFKIGFPNEECRAIYLNSIKGDQDVDVDKWVKDTEGFSFAHLKELFVATKVLGDEYDAALATLLTMRQRISTDEKEEFDRKKVGFSHDKHLQTSANID